MTEKEIRHLLCFHESLDHRLTVQALQELAALRAELAEWKHLAEIRSKGICELTEQLAEAKAEVERQENRHAEECMAMMAQRQYDEVQFAELQHQLAEKTAEVERVNRELSMTKNNLITSFGGKDDTAPHLLAFAGGAMYIGLQHQLAAAKAAREAAERLVATGTNYTCDHDTYPWSVKFANGRTVQIKAAASGVYLDIGWIEQPKGDGK